MKVKQTSFGPLYDGVQFKAEIHGDPVEGKIYIPEKSNCIYLCQNSHPGANCIDKKGYTYSWVMNPLSQFISRKFKKDEHICDEVTNLRLGNKMEQMLHQIST